MSNKIIDLKDLSAILRRKEKQARRISLAKKASLIASVLVLASATTYYAGKIFAGPKGPEVELAKIYTNDDVNRIYARYGKERNENYKNESRKSIDSIVSEEMTELKKNNYANTIPIEKTSRVEYKFLEKRVEEKISNWNNTITKEWTDKNGYVNRWKSIDSVKERLTSTSPLIDYIHEGANQNTFDKNLFYALTAWESEGKLKAQSTSGAKGPWQIMPETGKKRGLTMNKFIDERSDPQKASFVGTDHILDARSRYGENILLILADYNCGGCTLNKIIRQNGVKLKAKEALPKLDETTLEKIYQDLPDETQDYIVKLLATKKLLDEGINFEKKDSLKKIIDNSTIYEVKPGETLFKIAMENNVSIEHIKEKNPQIIKYTRIKKGMKIRL